MPEILLRFVEGAGVALYRHDESQGTELIAPRRDLYDYSGGYAWGCGGAGPANLSYAIVGKVFEDRRLGRLYRPSSAVNGLGW